MQIGGNEMIDNGKNLVIKMAAGSLQFTLVEQDGGAVVLVP